MFNRLIHIYLTLAPVNSLSEKRVSAVAISKNGRFVCFADKFGMVYVTDIESVQEKQDIPSKKAVPILSHYCSIITSLVLVFLPATYIMYFYFIFYFYTSFTRYLRFIKFSFKKLY